MAGEDPAAGAGSGADACFDSSTRGGDAAAEHAAARERIRASESLKARQLVDGTPLRGWYLKRNGSLAVDGDANFYVMSTATSFRARITGADVAPTDPL